VTIQNASEWLRAGAGAISIGSSVLSAEALREGDVTDIATKARALVEVVRSFEMAERPRKPRAVTCGEVLIAALPAGLCRSTLVNHYECSSRGAEANFASVCAA